MKGCPRHGFLCSTILCFILLFCSGTSLAADNLNFPLRAKYSHLQPIETQELASIYSNAIIVDSRNRVEYNVVHMDGAKNILVGRMREGDLLELRSKTDKKPLVFYCNGTTCAKSYKAANKATMWGFKNVLVYDPGIFFWATNQPEKTLFFDQPLTKETVNTALISKERFNNRLLSTKDFIDKANSGQFTVVDGRDIEDIQVNPIELQGLRIMSIDLMANLLKRNSWVMPKTNLLIFDNVGKQVKWLQYYLENSGVTNYYFLKGGVRQWKADGYDKAGQKK